MSRMWIAIGLAALLSGTATLAQVETDIRSGEQLVSTMLMGEGDHVVIALHGGSGTTRHFFFQGKGGHMGQKLASAGFRVIAITWSGQSGGGFNEIDTAIAHARATGARKISLMGHSRGGELAASYVLKQADGTIDTVIQFSSADDKALPMSKTKKLFAFNKYDEVARWQAAAFAKSGHPKQLIELGGSGHPVSALIGEKADLVKDVVRLLHQ